MATPPLLVPQLTGSNKEVSPRVMTQSDLKITEVEQKIQQITAKFCEIADGTEFPRPSSLLTLHSMIYQLKEKARVVRRISKDEPKKYRELYTQTISINLSKTSEKFIQTLEKLEKSKFSERTQILYPEAKKILKAIDKLK